ncbi:MAG: phytanoyl-CoA dioxygenase family protein [Gammaproteobacteria bacterium]|nr:phytanoyl-CoA dioxygenase family protein [Gammaproteobacteria bacterium]
MSRQSGIAGTATDGELPYTTPDRLLRDFASRGIVALAPETLGIPLDIHEAIYEKEREAFNAGRYITASLIPEILDVITSPGVVAACDALVGKNWAIVPFTHNTPFPSGSRDQHWHKDDNGPYNLRKHRHHQAIQIEMLYYPQAVRDDNGPTAVIPYSQYWTFNHEENHDNFAGADHLDFGYQVGGMERLPVSGPNSAYDVEAIVNRRTAHDGRMRQAVANTGWPLVVPFEACPLKAGSVVLYSHNLFHRGNHRRDDWRTWKDTPRFMWRFWLYRTTEPDGKAPDEVDWRALGIDDMTRVDLSRAPDDATVLWRHHHHWLHTGRPPGRVADRDPKRLATQLYAKGEAAETNRIGAAYKLASSADADATLRLLGEALHGERESVRRAATYGLVALGSEATDVFLDATESAVKWVRKAGIYGLGDVAPLNERVLDAVADNLANDPSVYVRSVAANAVGCLGRRAVASGIGQDLIGQCVNALVESLAREENRLGMNIAQDRSIKFVRPTDECDVCEGIGINYSTERFKRVRSAVRENALTSMVVLCSHGAALLRDGLEPTVAALVDIVRTDANVFSVGLALDSLNRLANVEPGKGNAIRKELLGLLEDMPIHSWEPLVRSGLDPSVVREFSQAEIERP